MIRVAANRISGNILHVYIGRVRRVRVRYITYNLGHQNLKPNLTW
jgi:hypothetical protein